MKCVSITGLTKQEKKRPANYKRKTIYIYIYIYIILDLGGNYTAPVKQDGVYNCGTSHHIAFTKSIQGQGAVELSDVTTPI